MKLNKFLLLPLLITPALAGCKEDEKPEDCSSCQTCVEFEEDSLFKVDEETFNNAKAFTGMDYGQVYFSRYILLSTSTWNNFTMNRTYLEFAPDVLKQTDSDGDQFYYYKENDLTYEESIIESVYDKVEVDSSNLKKLSDLQGNIMVTYEDIKDHYDENAKHYIFQTKIENQTYDNLLRFYKGKIVEYYSECSVNNFSLKITEMSFSYNEVVPTHLSAE